MNQWLLIPEERLRLLSLQSSHNSQSGSYVYLQKPNDLDLNNPAE